MRRITMLLCAGFALFHSAPVRASMPILGTVEVDGSAWVSSGGAAWTRLSSTRPLLIGERLKTDSDGYLLIDLGAHGILGLYANSSVAASRKHGHPRIEVRTGKVAFFIPVSSDLLVEAPGAMLTPQFRDPAADRDRSVNGYVQVNGNGDGVITVEEGSLLVQRPGGLESDGSIFVENRAETRVGPGQRLLIGRTNPAPVQPPVDAGAKDVDAVATRPDLDVPPFLDSPTVIKAASAVGGITALVVLVGGSGGDANPSP